ncbi:MAG TPA: hypothetical protein VMD47_04325 [Candidatus Acidoferrales bacterium]|nr:hypothetical protein [Candidatus Acidoferrales bacterium]
MAVDAVNGNGLKTALDTIVAPKAAFESIRVAPTWGLAFVIALAVSTLAAYLITPALVHAYPGTFAHQVATDPRLSGMSADQQHMVMQFGEKGLGFAWVFGIISTPVVIFFAALVMLIFDKIGHGDGSLMKYWAASSNIAIVGLALAGIIGALIIMLRGAGSFDTEQAVQQAGLSLAMFVPSSQIKLVAFLSAMTPFSLWTLGLNVAAMRIVGKVGAVSAWLAGLVILLAPAIVAASAAK